MTGSAAMAGRLPGGRAGQVLAAGVLAVLLGLVWLVVVAPLVAWYADRADELDTRRALAVRMAQVAAELPALRQAGAGVRAAAPVPVLTGATDAVAGAQLQQSVQDLARKAGATLASAELLAVEPVGQYRRVALRITLRASWPMLVGLMRDTAEAEPAMTIDDVQIHGGSGFIREAAAALDASWTVIAFRPGAAQ